MSKGGNGQEKEGRAVSSAFSAIEKVKGWKIYVRDRIVTILTCILSGIHQMSR